MSKAHEQAVKRYNAKTYSEFTLRLKKEDADELRAHLNGMSANGYITQAIKEKMERDGGARSETNN